MAFQLFFAFSDKDFSAKDQAVRQLSPDSNIHLHNQRGLEQGVEIHLQGEEAEGFSLVVDHLVVKI